LLAHQDGLLLTMCFNDCLKVLLVGPAADTLVQISGGWTLHWQVK